ncbi:hypothetical protein SSPS47_11410 [Streptomyces sp. S4.7]|nr:hypothetical protein SSPS47_11410 [Streptomyces sp. S4.7]
MALRRKAVGAPIRTRGRGTVRVMKDANGHQWVTCSGCRLDSYAPGVSPARFAARRHAAECIK